VRLTISCSLTKRANNVLLELGVDNASLYTQPEDILDIHNALFPISPAFSIAAGFGNVHGVYKPGNVKLQPELLAKHQKYAHEQLKSENPLPIYLVFHGGSGSTKEEIKTAVENGVVKMNGKSFPFFDFFPRLLSPPSTRKQSTDSHAIL
jgi:fructose/tagatose bisphosphate aldolase